MNIELLKSKVTDFIANSVATWGFIIMYSFCIFLWVFGHKFNFLKVDTSDFLYYNLFISWITSVQAAILLMYSNKESMMDRKNILKSLEYDKKTLEELDKLDGISKKINKLEEIIILMENEEAINNEKTRVKKVRKTKQKCST